MENALASLPEDLDPDLGQTVMKVSVQQVPLRVTADMLIHHAPIMIR